MDTWDYAHTLPYFKKMETCLAGADEWWGGGGPLKLERGPATSRLFRAFFEAVQQAGYELTKDVNGYRHEGFAAFDRNIYRGHRLSAARAYLHPVMRRPNLEVRTRVMVDRVLFYGGRATGVELVDGNQVKREVAGEVILCGGRSTRPSCSSSPGLATRGSSSRWGSNRSTTCPASARTSRTTSRSTFSTRPSSRCRWRRR
jgi:choline dehydrogenase